MESIQFIYKPEMPVPYQSIITKVDENNVLKHSPTDSAIIRKMWSDLKKEKGNAVFSKKLGLGCLHDYDLSTQTFAFQPTDFKTYVSTALSYSDGRPLSQSLYDTMRIGVVGAVLKIKDESIFVQRRSSDLPVSRGMIDSSVAGFCHRDLEGRLDFQKAISEKLEKELGLSFREIGDIKLSAVHSSRGYDFSGTFDFVLKTSLSQKELESRINKHYIEEHFFVSERELPEFILHHYLDKKDMSSEGCATLLASLPLAEFSKTGDSLRSRGENIELGTLKQGQFHKA